MGLGPVVQIALGNGLSEGVGAAWEPYRPLLVGGWGTRTLTHLAAAPPSASRFCPESTEQSHGEDLWGPRPGITQTRGQEAHADHGHRRSPPLTPRPRACPAPTPCHPAGS